MTALGMDGIRGGRAAARWIALAAAIAVGLAARPAAAHPGGHGTHASPFGRAALSAARRAPLALVAAPRADGALADVTILDAFAPFVDRGDIATRREGRFFLVESRGMPDHPLMVGIRAWQQQVPLPHPYEGDNAWKIPLEPVPAAEPALAKDRFLRGAIALAVNGIPIFNPLNNRGADSFAIGELDEYGGHCGRADDYHYHIAPIHLEKVVGRGKPIAWALDGYPVYGLTEPDGTPAKPLDACHGHDDPVIGYHYHAAERYPYFIGAFHGEVVERDGQVDPQPRAQGVREALPPLRGARIIGFEAPSPTTRKLTYEVDGRKGTVEYTLAADGMVTFRYTDPQGRTTTEEARPRQRGAGQGGPRRDGQRPPPPDAARRGGQGQVGRGPGGGDGGGPGRGAPRGDRPPAEGAGEGAPLDRAPPGPVGAGEQASGVAQLTVRCPAVGADGRLPVEFTCDGARVSPPVEWSEGPPGTRCYAVTLWHEAPDRVKSSWVVHGIPATVRALPRDSRAIGTLGTN
ncbi:MAG: YHYH protein, partial [Planctomycetaceae bacterium]